MSVVTISAIKADVIVFAADKCAPGAWNLPLYAMFCDPINTAGLVIDTAMHRGFTVEVHDLIDHRSIRLTCPAELYDLLAFIGTPGRWVPVPEPADAHAEAAG